MSSLFGFNINKFLSGISRSGIAHANRYEISFGSIGGSLAFDQATQTLMNERLESVSVPGSGIGSNAVKLQGIDREMPYGRLYEGDITVSFLEDSKFTIRNAFIDWQKKVIDETNYTLGFYEDYICSDMFVSVVSNTRQQQIIHKVRVYDIFPKSVDGFELSGASEELVKTQIQLSYRRWTAE